MIESKYLQDNMQNIQKLMNIPTLKHFEIKSLGKLLKLSKIREYEDGEVIIKEGEINMTKVTIPKHLKSETKIWIKKILNAYEFELHHVKILIQAAEQWDRITEARERVAKEGAYFTDFRGQPRSHPGIADERNGRVVFARLIRELNLSEGPGENRPPSLKYK